MNETRLRLKIAAVWIVVLFNITFAAIIEFLYPGTLGKMMNGNGGLPITPEILLEFSVLTAVTVATIFLTLTRTLPVKASRVVSTLALLLTMLYAFVGASATLSYIFLASANIANLGALTWYVWKWFTQRGTRKLPLRFLFFPFLLPKAPPSVPDSLQKPPLQRTS